MLPSTQNTCRIWALAGLLLATVLSIHVEAQSTFQRGDFDGDGTVSIADPIAELGYLFLGAAAPECRDAADATDDGTLDITDPLYILNYLFQSGAPTPAPGPDLCGIDPTFDTLDCVNSPCPPINMDLIEAGHVLSRAAYGPGPRDHADVLAIGAGAWLNQQLNPMSIDESANDWLNNFEDAIIDMENFNDDQYMIPLGASWRYLKGHSEPATNWTSLVYDDAAWLVGNSGIGYGDNDDATVLSDMQNNYISVYTRHIFEVTDPSSIETLLLRVDFDDGFVAYLNGVEVARDNINGSPPAFDTPANSNHEAFVPIDYILNSNDLLPGSNVLAIQIHNRTLGNGDLSLRPELVDRTTLPFPPRPSVFHVEFLRLLPHTRGIYANRQLQTVLAEFWENHFTTDNDKLRVVFRDLVQDSDGSPAMDRFWSSKEAAQIDFDEYEFFTENALGNFGDLLLYSATSPSMLVYLDNVTNFKNQPNENYAREIQELHSLGVDNGYTQADIEEVARCFTGWTIKKISRYDLQDFPDSATNPPTTPSTIFSEDVFIELGDLWQYFKGTAEPSSGTTAWTELGFDVSSWLSGPTGIGFGDGDDATILNDMQGNYSSVYLRHEFVVADPSSIVNFVLEASYDDGFVAYLNGVEVARSDSMPTAPTPPTFDSTSANGHEAQGPAEVFSLQSFTSLVVPGTNVFAIQVHNVNLNSNDLSILPRIVSRVPLPGSIEHSNRSGIWTFRFDPDQHDTDAKVVFPGTPYQLDIPAGRLGVDGVLDGLELIESLVAHPNTAQHISIKLIQRFVSDDITVATANDLSAPVELRALLASMIGAWFSTSPPGNIGVVMNTLLDPDNKASAFWNPDFNRAKVKSPIEHVNAAIRALDGNITGRDLPNLISSMGMNLFTRDFPDGWPERGGEWVDSGSMLARINYVRRLSANDDPDYGWAVQNYLAAHSLVSSQDIVEFFNNLLFQGLLPPATASLLVQFGESDENGDPLPLVPGNADYIPRVESLVGLILSLPQSMFQ